MEIMMPSDVQYILHMLMQSGYEAFIVGGCVRDSIMGIEPHDWDICTSALPQKVSEIFNGHKIIPTGLKHGTVTIVLPSGQYEITTYRIDGKYNDGRHPDNVYFTNNLLEDLKRRDFTINAIAYNQEQGLIDFFGGVKDIKNKIIRCVGNPNKRFKEDALRMLRAIRFSATLSFKISMKTMVSLLENKHLFKNVSIERINSELTKFLKGLALNRLNILLMGICLKNVFPEIGKIDNDKISKLISPYLCSGTYNQDLKLIISLAILLGKDEVSLNDNLKKLKYDNNTIKKTISAYKFGKLILNFVIKKTDINMTYIIRKIISDIGYELATFAVEYIRVYDYSLYFQLQFIMVEVLHQCNSISEMKICGDDLIDLGYSGKQIGTCLRCLLDYIIRGYIENDKKALILKAIDLKDVLQ